MAFKANSSDVKVVGGGLWTGLSDMRVTLINPTKAEMEAVGMSPKQDPEYLTQDNDNINKLRIDIYLNDAVNKINAKIAFWLEAKPRWNKDKTKVEWINSVGTTAWSNSDTIPPQYDWFKTEGARPALVGEGNLTRFIKAWANLDPKDQATFDDIMAFANGNISEIKALQKAIPNNLVKVLLGVKLAEKANYQDVYPYYFERPYKTAYDPWQKALANDGQEFKSDHQGSLKLQPYTGNASVAQDSPSNLDGPNGPQSNNPPAGQPRYNF